MQNKQLDNITTVMMNKEIGIVIMSTVLSPRPYPKVCLLIVIQVHTGEGLVNIKAST